MGGNRKHGFLRGNANGRNGLFMPKPFFCHGCNKIHCRTVERTIGLDNLIYCDRYYYSESNKVNREKLMSEWKSKKIIGDKTNE